MDTPLPSLDLLDDFGIGDLNSAVTNYQAPPDEPRRRLLRSVPGEPNSYVMEIDNSSLEQFTVCHKSAENYLIWTREGSAPASALNYGTAMHKALDIRLRYGLSAAIEQKMIEVVMDHFGKHPQPPDEFRSCDRAILEIKRYNKKHPEPEVYEIVRDENDEPMVEIPFNFPFFTVELDKTVPYKGRQLVEGWDVTNDMDVYISRIYVVWTGRIDGIIRMDKQYWIMDHKTTTIGGDNYGKEYSLANQMRGYTWAARKLTGLPIKGLFLNTLIARAPTKTGTPSEFFRGSYPYRDDQITEWVDDTQQLILNFLHALSAGKFPQETKWCYGKYGRCQYWDLCNIPADQRHTYLGSTAFRDVTWSPLLVRV